MINRKTLGMSRIGLVATDCAPSALPSQLLEIPLVGDAIFLLVPSLSPSARSMMALGIHAYGIRILGGIFPHFSFIAGWI